MFAHKSVPHHLSHRVFSRMAKSLSFHNITSWCSCNILWKTFNHNLNLQSFIFPMTFFHISAQNSIFFVIFHNILQVYVVLIYHEILATHFSLQVGPFLKRVYFENLMLNVIIVFNLKINFNLLLSTCQKWTDIKLGLN